MTDKEMLEEFEKLGEHALEAKLKTQSRNLPPDYVRKATEWLLERQADSAHQRDQEVRKREEKVLISVQTTAKATWVLAIATIVLVLVTIFVVIVASDDARENREQQSKDQKELLRAQVAIELDKEFDSLEMRQARRRLAKQLLNKTEITEDRVPDFFDKLGFYMHQGRIDEETVYYEFSGMVEMYWPALKQSILDSRHADNASEEDSHFEKLYSEMLARDKAGPDHFTGASPQEVKDFLISERDLPN